MIGGKQYERTVALVDVSERDSYVVDVFRVVGGKEHAKFLHTTAGEVAATHGLKLKPTEGFGEKVLVRNVMHDPSPAASWRVDWRVRDPRESEPSDVHLRCHDLTAAAEALTAETWASADGRSASQDAWLPSVVVRRRGDEPLASTFVSVLEPYRSEPLIASVHRLALAAPDGRALPDANVGVEIRLADGRRDLFVALDAPHKHAVQREWRLRVSGELCMVRLDATGAVERLALARGQSVEVSDARLELTEAAEFIEARWENGKAVVVAGDPAAVAPAGR